MRLEDMKILAKSEIFDIAPYIKEVKKIREYYPEGIDLTIPSHLSTKLEEYFDENKIPFYIVTEGTVSTAMTYSQLLSHEASRLIKK